MNKNNIDRLFQEKLKDFQELPDERVWRSIEASLEKKKRSHPIILPLWWKAAGVAAVFAILFFVIDPFSGSHVENPVITDIENIGADKIDIPEKSNAEKDALSEPTGITSVEKDAEQQDTGKPAQVRPGSARPASVQIPDLTLAGQKNKTQTDPSTTNPEVVGLIPKNKERSALGTDPSLANGTTTKDTLPIPAENAVVDGHENNLREENNKTSADIDKKAIKKSILDEIEKQREELEIAETTKGKWSAGPSIAPVYFDAIGKGSPINPMLEQNPKSGSVTLSYGINVAYEISKKVSIRSGIHKVDFGYNTNNVAFTSSFNALSEGQLDNINYNSTAQSIIIEGMGRINSIPLPNSPNANDVMAKNPGRMGTMGQQIGYLEVPLEVNYALLDRKFGIDLIGGISSLFLTDNSIILQSSGKTTELGEANNINSVNFSTNVGLGINYKFTDKLMLNIEPVFKYQLNTFDNASGSFNPYSLGVYSGFNFKF